MQYRCHPFKLKLKPSTSQPTQFREIFRKSSYHVNTNKAGIVKQSGNDVESYRSQKVLFQLNVRVFLQYSVTSPLIRISTLASAHPRNGVVGLRMIIPAVEICQSKFRSAGKYSLSPGVWQSSVTIRSCNHLMRIISTYVDNTKKSEIS